MARGNCQARIERAEARRIAAKLKKENRLNNRLIAGGGGGDSNEEYGNNAPYRRLLDWLGDNGAVLLASFYQGQDSTEKLSSSASSSGHVIVDIWTDSRPESRQEYLPALMLNNDNDEEFDDEGPAKGRSSKNNKQKDRGKGKDRGGFQKGKGKAHPNAKNKLLEKYDEEYGGGLKALKNNATATKHTNTPAKLCGQDFFFGKEKCNFSSKHMNIGSKNQSKKGGGGRGKNNGIEFNNGGCSFHHYHQFPKAKRGGAHCAGVNDHVPQSPPLTLYQVVNGKYQPHFTKKLNTENNSKATSSSLPIQVRESILQSAFNAAVSFTAKAASATFDAEDTIGDGTDATKNEGQSDSDSKANHKNACMDMVYHSRLFVVASEIDMRNINEVHNETCNDNNGNELDDDGDGESLNSESDRSANSDSDEDDDGSSDEDSANSDSDNDEGSSTSNKNERNSITLALQQILHNENVSPVSLVYLAIQGVVIYDRHRGGLVVSAGEVAYLLSGDDISNVVGESYNESIDGPQSSSMQESLHIHERLTYHILDEILSYLEDEATAILPQVCSSWNSEIGKRSPQLWKMLLGRNGWPLVASDDVKNLAGTENDELDACKQYRHAFVSHYTAIRDVRAMVAACNSLKSGSAASSSSSGGRSKHNRRHGFEYAMQAFKATKGAPVLDWNGRNKCVVKVWSDGINNSASVGVRALSAYADDCTLRLFEAVRSSSSSTSNTHATTNAIKCRQIVCVRAAPPSISRKKNNCDLSSMDLDDDVVACLVEETQEENDSRTLLIPWMTVISRDDLVCAGNEGILDDDCIQSFDLRAAIFDYVMGTSVTSDEHGNLPYDGLRDPLHNYLAISGGDTYDITITVSPKIVACGKGHVLFHAFISIPQYSELAVYDEVVEDPSRMHHPSNGNRLFLFSSHRDRAIVKSMQLDVYPLSVGLFASRPFRRRANATTVAATCTNVLAVIRNTPLFISVEVQNNGKIDIASNLAVHEERTLSMPCINAVVTRSDIILPANPGLSDDCVLLFRNNASCNALNDVSHYVAVGGRGSKVVNLNTIKEDYVLAIVATRSNNDDEDDEEMELFDGHWFGNDDVSYTAVVFHIPTRQEIYRCSLPSEPLSIDACGDTIAVNVSTIGFVMTGCDARDVGRISYKEQCLDNALMSSPAGKTPKPKKKRLASKTVKKKDEFARGMSLRG